MADDFHFIEIQVKRESLAQAACQISFPASTQIEIPGDVRL